MSSLPHHNPDILGVCSVLALFCLQIQNLETPRLSSTCYHLQTHSDHRVVATTTNLSLLFFPTHRDFYFLFFFVFVFVFGVQGELEVWTRVCLVEAELWKEVHLLPEGRPEEGREQERNMHSPSSHPPASCLCLLLAKPNRTYGSEGHSTRQRGTG